MTYKITGELLRAVFDNAILHAKLSPYSSALTQGRLHVLVGGEEGTSMRVELEAPVFQTGSIFAPKAETYTVTQEMLNECVVIRVGQEYQADWSKLIPPLPIASKGNAVCEVLLSSTLKMPAQG